MLSSSGRRLAALKPPFLGATRNRRRFTTPAVVDLEHNASIPTNGNEREGALVILHGLFGSKRNWMSLTKAFARDLGKPVYALDLRNQGSSPHRSPMDYTHMAADVLHFIQQRSLSGVSLIGHSMGGKVAMTLALNPTLPAQVLSNLIVEDVAPTKTELSPEFKSYIHAMKKIEASTVKTRKEAKEIIQEYEKDQAVQQFLLTNLIIPPTSSPESTKFQIPLSILSDAIPNIGSFPYEPSETAWTGRTLFVKGARSKYINQHNLPLCEAFFPQMRLESLDTGHWVHSEKPNEFKELVAKFIQQ